jgi:L-rhamnonate dehydratase
VRAYVPDPQVKGTDYTDQEAGHWIVDTVIANPMSVYPAYKASRTSWGIDALSSAIVEIELDSGLTGVGITTGGEPACYIVERHLKRFLVGQDPRDIEKMWDQMWRATMPYGRKGLPIHAISAVDLALWDVLGRLRGEPVYHLLGGKTKDRLPVYATTPRPDYAQTMGFHGAKMPLPHGPADGQVGLQKNVAMVAEARAQVGPDFDLMLDCYMALSVPYTIELARAVAPYRVKWIEEFLPPDDYDGYAQVKAAVASCLLTTGEHEYTRYGFRELISRKAVDILQPDILWCGGITEARRIVAMAAAYDIPVIPHGSSVFSYHLQFAYANCPMAEFLVMSPRADHLLPLFGGLFAGEPIPQDGYIALSDEPGFGVTLDRTAVRLRRPYGSN